MVFTIKENRINKKVEIYLQKLRDIGVEIEYTLVDKYAEFGGMKLTNDDEIPVEIYEILMDLWEVVD